MGEKKEGVIQKIQNAYHSEENTRLLEIIDILSKHQVIQSLATQSNPNKVRIAFEELGPTFVKIGQILSVRTDIVSPAFAEEFKKLQDNVKSDEFHSIKEVIEKETGISLEQIFEEIDEKPLASASMGQIHIAKIKNGKKVVVKVQHPGIDEIMTRDIALFEKAVPLIKHIPSAGMIDPAEMVAELKRSLMQELDFNNEADNIELFYKNNKDINIISPRVYRQYSTKRLLVMDCMDGRKISDYIAQADNAISEGNTAYKEQKKKFADILVKNYMKQIFDDGFFHADPHPGNVLVGRANKDDEADISEEKIYEIETPVSSITATVVDTKTPDENNEEKIILIDFGMMGRLDEITLDKFNQFIAALITQNNAKIAKAILNLCKSDGSTDLDKLEEDAGKLFSKYFDMAIGSMSLPLLFEEMSGICLKNGLTLPSNITLLFKGIATIEGIVLRLDPNMSLMTAIEPYAKRYIRSQFNLHNESEQFISNLILSLKAAPEIPLKLSNLMDAAAKGKLKVNMEHRHLEDSFDKLSALVNQLSMAIIVAALIVGSSMLVNYSDNAARLAASSVGSLGYLVAIILAGIMIFKSWHKKKNN